MFDRLRNRRLLPLAALTLVALLGGCVAYPGGYYGYNDGYYGSGYYGTPYYSGATVAIGSGWGWRGGDHDRDWHERGERGRWRGGDRDWHR